MKAFKKEIYRQCDIMAIKKSNVACVHRWNITQYDSSDRSGPLVQNRTFLFVHVFWKFKYPVSQSRGFEPPYTPSFFESPWPKDNLCQVWLKLARWFWRRVLDDPIPYLHFCDYLPLEEDLVLYLNKLESRFVPRLIQFHLLVLEEKIFQNCQCIFILSLLSPLGEGLSPSVE